MSRDSRYIHQVVVRVGDDLQRHLRDDAAFHGRTVAQTIRLVLEQHFGAPGRTPSVPVEGPSVERVEAAHQAAAKVRRELADPPAPAKPLERHDVEPRFK